MPAIRLVLNPMRTAQQGVHINVGKDGDAYKEITTTLSIKSPRHGGVGDPKW